MSSIHTLVVGQGLAGTLTAFMLYRKNLSFRVIDPGHTNTASRIAAGMFTPVAGKRKTIPQGGIEQVHFAADVYREMEALLGRDLLHRQPIYELCYTAAEQAGWEKRIGEIDFNKLVTKGLMEIAGFQKPLSSYEVAAGGWLDCGAMISSFASWLEKQGLLIRGNFLYDALEITGAGLHHQGLAFKNIIFCQGYQPVNNPFFKEEMIIPCKGDLLSINYDQQDTGFILKAKGLYFIQTAGDTLRVGATYQWNNDSTEPDIQQRQLLESQIQALLTGPFSVIDHRSAVRPTTANREVIAKRHGIYPNMFFLNGLGTRGVMQAPWWAAYLVNQLVSA